MSDIDTVEPDLDWRDCIAIRTHHGATLVRIGDSDLWTDLEDGFQFSSGQVEMSEPTPLLDGKGEPVMVVVLGLLDEIERLTGEPTEDEVEVGAKEIWRWFVGSSLEGFYRHAYAYDREKCMDACRAALRAARGLS